MKISMNLREPGGILFQFPSLSNTLFFYLLKLSVFQIRQIRKWIAVREPEDAFSVADSIPQFPLIQHFSLLSRVLCLVDLGEILRKGPCPENVVFSHNVGFKNAV